MRLIQTHPCITRSYIVHVFIVAFCTVIHSCYGYKYGCGQLQRPYGTIRGGIEAEPGAWPWIASLRLSENNGREHICAGTLIGRRFVITAAHCLLTRSGLQRRAADLLIIVGTQTLDPPYTSAHESVLSVRRVITHPLYGTAAVRPWAYDLALLQLDTEPSYEDVSRPACLPLDNAAPLDGETCLIAGWGKTETARFSRTLMQADVPIMSRQECNQPQFWDGYIDKSMLCALNQKQSRASSCQGDSGGPLICERNGQYYLYGVISWGPIICGDKPGVFTNVAHVSDWLQSVLEVAGEDIDPGSTHNRVNSTSIDMYDSSEATVINPVHPPCDADLFERKDGWLLFGPAPQHYEITETTIEACMQACCARGFDECQSFVYFHRKRKCNLRKVTRCDLNVYFRAERTNATETTAGGDGAVTYYGRKQC